MSKDNSTSLNTEGSSYAPQQQNHFEAVGMSNGDQGARITSRVLNPNGTAGVIAKPSFGGGEPDSFGMVQTADVTNAEANGEANTTASTANLSAKYKRPSVSQDQGAGGAQWNTPQ